MRPSLSFPLTLLAGAATGFLLFRGPLPLSSPVALLRAAAITSSSEQSADSPASTNAKTQRLLAAALRKDEGIDRDNELYLAIEALTVDDFRHLLNDPGAIKAMIAKLSDDFNEGTCRNLVSGLVARWLAVDPSGALAWAPHVFEETPSEAEEMARGFMLLELTRQRPTEMLALAASRKDASERVEIISFALRELAQHDPAKARAWLDACKDPADRLVAERAWRAGIVQTDPLRGPELAAAATDRTEGGELMAAAAKNAARTGLGTLRQLATSPMQPWMLWLVLSELGPRDPELAIDLALKAGVQGMQENLTLQSAFVALTQRDPAQAISRLDALGPRERAVAVSAIGRSWVGRDPAAALTWMAGLPQSQRSDPNRSNGGTHDSLLMAYDEWVEGDRPAARAWAEALPEGPTRNAVEARFAQMLAYQGDPAEATRILARLGATTDPMAIHTVAGAWARIDPGAAADWAIAQPSGPAQSSALAGIVDTWAKNDPTAVQGWLAQFPPGDARDRSVAAFLARDGIFFETAEAQLAEFDTWFDLIDDPWTRAQAATESYWQRQARDPAGARTWLTSLPNLDPAVVRLFLLDHRN